MVKQRKRWRPVSTAPRRIGDQVHELLRSMGGTPERCRLSGVWTNWEKVVGAELARIAVPAGSHRRTLLLAAEDAMQIQELQFLSCDILERVNHYIGSAYFTALRPILGGKNCRQPVKPAPEEKRGRGQPNLPRVTGKYLAKMDMNSPVAICYARFAKRSS